MLFGPFWYNVRMYPVNGIEVESFRGMVCILDFGLAILEVFFDYSIP